MSKYCSIFLINFVGTIFDASFLINQATQGNSQEGKKRTKQRTKKEFFFWRKQKLKTKFHILTGQRHRGSSGKNSVSYYFAKFQFHPLSRAQFASSLSNSLTLISIFELRSNPISIEPERDTTLDSSGRRYRFQPLFSHCVSRLWSNGDFFTIVAVFVFQRSVLECVKCARVWCSECISAVLISFRKVRCDSISRGFCEVMITLRFPTSVDWTMFLRV